MVLNLKHASETIWLEICKKVKNAIVFVDDASGECLHWHGGLLRLFRCGATSVKQFSSFETGGESKKAVFIVSSPLVGPTRIILRDLIVNSKFEHCILITSCSPVVLTIATTGNVPEGANEMTAIHKLELDMQRWMKSKDPTAEIFHFPFSLVPLTNYFFAIPPFNGFSPCFTEDLQGKTLYAELPRNLDLEALPLELQIGVMYLMTTINSILSQLSAQEEIYCMGLLSSLVGSQLQKHSSSALRAKIATNKVSLVLIDRTLDLCSATYCSKDVFLDKMKSVLPQFPGHGIDVAIDMSPLCYAKNRKDQEIAAIAPGCLHEPPSDIFDLLINKPTKEIILEMYKRLAPACLVKGTPQSVSTKELENLIFNNFQKKYDKIQCCSETIQASLGIIETLNSPQISMLELMESTQKMIMQSVAAEGNTDEALKQLRDLVISKDKRGFNVEMILTIITFFYCLIGNKYDINRQLEDDIKNELASALCKDKNTFGTVGTLLEKVTESSAKDFCEHIFKKLNYLRNARAHLTKYNNIVRHESQMHPLEYNSLINQLVCDIVDVRKPELTDLRYKANYGLRDNFTTRFSMILNVSKPHIMDNDNIMFFIIGGVTAGEVKFIKDIFRAYKKEVIIGSTCLVSNTQVLYNLYNSDPLKPFVI